MLLGAITSSHNAYFSTKRFLKEAIQLLPLQKRKLIFLPVGSTINLDNSATESSFRNEYNLLPEDKILILFGPPHPSKSYKFILDSIYEINHQLKSKYKILAIGSTLEQLKSLGDYEYPLDKLVTATGKLEENEVASAFRYSTALLAYFTDGLSTRRSSVMSALNQGLPVISTKSEYTEDIFSNQDGVLLFSTNELEFRLKLQSLLSEKDLEFNRVNIKKFYSDNFSWKAIASIITKS